MSLIVLFTIIRQTIAQGTTQGSTGCPGGQSVVQCFVDPCLVAQCPQQPGATCVSDYCGGCNARFFLGTTRIPQCDYPRTTGSTVKPPTSGTVKPPTKPPTSQPTVKPPTSQPTAKPTAKPTPRPTISPDLVGVTLFCPKNYTATVPNSVGDQVASAGVSLNYSYPQLNKPAPADVNQLFRIGQPSGGPFNLGVNIITFIYRNENGSKELRCSFNITISVEPDDFFTQNAKNKGVVTTPTGLQYRILKAGNGTKPGMTDIVTFEYEGRFLNGTIFDTTTNRPALVVAANRLIRGMTEVLTSMRAGAEWEAWIPYYLAYGRAGVTDPSSGRVIIPALSTLHFSRIALLSVKPAPPTSAPASSP